MFQRSGLESLATFSTVPLPYFTEPTFRIMDAPRGFEPLEKRHEFGIRLGPPKQPPGRKMEKGKKEQDEAHEPECRHVC